MLTAQHAGHVVAVFGGDSWSLLQRGIVVKGRVVQGGAEGPMPWPRQATRLLLSSACELVIYSAIQCVCVCVHASAPVCVYV